jgi:hypothetical protein
MRRYIYIYRYRRCIFSVATAMQSRAIKLQYQGNTATQWKMTSGREFCNLANILLLNAEIARLVDSQSREEKISRRLSETNW